MFSFRKGKTREKSFESDQVTKKQTEMKFNVG